MTVLYAWFAARWVQITLIVVAAIGGTGWWLLHDHKEQVIGEDKCSIPKAEGDLANLKAQQAEIDRLRGVVSTYEKNAAIPDPIVTGVAQRVLVYAACPNPMPAAASVTSAARSPAAVPASDPAFEGLLDAAFKAAGHDDAQLNAIQQAWPK